jgi:signal transduction histidine kinase
VTAACSVRALAAAIEVSTTRISELVEAVKGFTFMDRARAPQPVDVRRGVTETLTMLQAKTRAKSAEIALRFPDRLAPAHGVGAELNQVWINLIDNALDAVGTGGEVIVSAKSERGRVLVEIVDDGPGIPPEIRPQIFDPFFTTKGVGKGRGLGLDVVRRLVSRHDGSVEVESIPGRTTFRVNLPAASPD